MKIQKIRADVRITLLYLLFGGLWIILTDRILAGTISDPDQLTTYQTYKGWLFVCISALLIFIILRREFHVRKITERQLIDSEEKYRTIIEVSQEAIFINQDNRITYINPAGVALLGAEDEDQIVGRKPLEIFHPDYHEMIRNRIDEMLQTNRPVPIMEEKVIRMDGKTVDVEITASPFSFQGGTAIQVALRDITQRKQAEDKLQVAEQQLLLAIKAANIGLWDWDLDTNEVYYSEEYKSQIGYEDHEISNDYSEWEKRVHPDDLESAKAKVEDFIKNPWPDYTNEFRFRHKDGSYRWILAQASLIRNAEGKPICMRGSHIDITNRKKMEEALRESEEKYRNFIRHSQSMFYTHTPDHRLTYVSPQSLEILGYQPHEAMIKWQEFLSDNPINQQGVQATEKALQTGERQPPYELELIKRGGGKIWVRVDESPIIQDGEVTGIVGSLTDISQQKHAKNELEQYTHHLEILNTVMTSLTQSLELDEVFDLILDQAQEIMPIDSATIFLRESNGLRVVKDRGLEPSNTGRIFSTDNRLFNEMMRSLEPIIIDDPQSDPRFENWGDNPLVQSWMGVPLLLRDDLIGHITIDSNQPNAYTPAQIRIIKSFAAQAAQSIENARQFALTESLVKRLSSLRQIEQAISGSLDLRVTMSVLLKHVLQQLTVDASAVLLYRKESQTLEMIAAQGSINQASLIPKFSIGKGVAGDATIEQRVIHLSGDDLVETELLGASYLTQNKFHSYFAVPLVSKGEVMGVLEIYHQEIITADGDWMEYLYTLGTEAAIAIDNITLYNSLRRSNIELLQAYDATIEGWAQALELRDMETEGHSRRVVDMTLELSSRMGISGDHLTHIRRGALLHDIGKMGIPDAILQKPGKLTDEEWVVMRQHPTYAFEWLSSIPYLRSALDIPKSHHEKWDGSGYPRGLQGKEIPLAARIFAIIDVFDALGSDRPYRKAWSRSKIIDYIKAESGKHFDPAVVVKFLEMMEQTSTSKGNTLS